MKRISLLLAVGVVAAGVFFAVSPFAGARTAAQAKTNVNVTAKEYKFVLSRRTAPHGVVVFHVVNKGKLKHDFKIAGQKTTLLRPNKSATLTVRLSKGKHAYTCTVKNHALYGMKGSFKAT